MVRRKIAAFGLISLFIGTATAHDYNIVDYGAKADTTVLSTTAVQQAIDACSKAGGGRVVVPSGDYKIGSIQLRSNVHLYLELGATLYGSTRLEDYRPMKSEYVSLRTQTTTIQLIYADKVSNVTISGQGVIDGRGRAFQKLSWNDEGITRPHLLRFIQSQDITVSGITLKNSGCWMQHYLACDRLKIDGIKVLNRNNYNNDALDLDGCHEVVVTNVIADSDDDGITLKSTSPRLCENVRIADCVVSSHCNAVKLGTETNGGFRNISISGIVVKPSYDQSEKFFGQWIGASAISLEIVDGGVLENVNVSDFTVEGTESPIFVRLGNRGRGYKLKGENGDGNFDSLIPVDTVGRINGIRLSNIQVHNAGTMGCSITGLPGHPVENVWLSDITIHHRGGVTKEELNTIAETVKDEKEREYPEATMWGNLPAKGFFLRHTRNVEFNNVRILTDQPDARPDYVKVDTEEQAWTGDFGKSVTWDRHSLMIDGRRVCPVMGEIHYSRLPANEWLQEIRKMKAGGVTMIATYVFWNHIEEQEGVFRWDGQRNLRRFIELCKQEQMPVVLRLGPFCHGESRNGGIPDWMFTKGCKMREQNPTFMHYAEELYRQIFSQVQGLQWKDGGPVIAAQFDNEYRGRGEYLMALKQIAQKVGFDLPFYTRTGWPELRTPVPFGELLPLYGDYADGFWDRTIEETAGEYYKAFNFKSFRSSTAIATEQIDYSQTSNLNSQPSKQEYPYFTCELGGGMATAYHRRPYIYPEDSYSMALVKLGSGSNLLGYYMYHGGTNPEGIGYLNENQRTIATNYNDLPVKTYDFQAPLGEFGQPYPQYYMLRPLHLFMQDWGETLAPMEPAFPAPQDLKKGDDSSLRWSVRSENGSGFIFVNNYERLQHLGDKKDVVLEACGVKLPKMTIPAGAMAIFPVNVDGIRYATAQLVARRDGKTYMMQIPGIPATICMQNGKLLKNVKPLGMQKPVYGNLYLLTRHDAEHLFLDEPQEQAKPVAIEYNKVREAGPLRPITIGVQRVAEEPVDEDFEQAAVYKIHLPQTSNLLPLTSNLLSITYRGDVARLYADGKLVADNFYYGRPFLFGLWRLPEGVKELELRILPLQKDAPIYLPREADKTPGEEVLKVEIK